MKRPSLIPFVLLNVIISVAAVYAALYFFDSQTPGASSVPQVITVEIRITTTPDPNATVPVRIITATPPPGSVAGLPTGLLETPDLTRSPAPTIDLTQVGDNPSLQSTLASLPPGCIPHTVADGDTPFELAEVYGVNPFDLMEVNGLTEETATLLQIGEVLIIPLENCPLTRADIFTEVPEEISVEDTEEPEAESTSTTPRPTVRPTLTLPPTAVDAQMEIIQVVGAGDITSEGVEIRNNGATVDLEGWTLTDGEGNEYTFGQRLIFSGSLITVYSRVGEDTPVALFWGRSEEVWGEPGDVVTLRDADGVVQSTYRLPAPVDLP